MVPSINAKDTPLLQRQLQMLLVLYEMTCSSSSSPWPCRDDELELVLPAADIIMLLVGRVNWERQWLSVNIGCDFLVFHVSLGVFVEFMSLHRSVLCLSLFFCFHVKSQQVIGLFFFSWRTTELDGLKIFNWHSTINSIPISRYYVSETTFLEHAIGSTIHCGNRNQMKAGRV